MILKYISLIITIIFATAFFSYVMTSSSQPPSERTGAPGEQTCGTTFCHNISSNLGNGNVAITFPDSLYAYDSTYTVNVRVNNPNQKRFGFELTVLEDSNNTNAGAITLTNTTNTALQSSSGRQYISHNNADDTKQWSFEWKAPQKNLGSITFYAAGNAADSNQASSGDTIYTNSLTIKPDTSKEADTTFIIDQPAHLLNVNIYPNPVQNHLWISFATHHSGDVKILLINQQGHVITRLLNNRFVKGHYKKRLTLPAHLSSGLYFIKIKQKNSSLFQKVFIK